MINENFINFSKNTNFLASNISKIQKIQKFRYLSSQKAIISIVEKIDMH